MEFNNDEQLCGAGLCTSGDPYYCSDATAHVQSKFDEMSGYSGNWWAPSGSYAGYGCMERGASDTSLSLTGAEFYRLACECSYYGGGYVSTVNNVWQVHYFSDQDCDNLQASSARFYSGYCGSASSVSVSIFASLAVAFVALKNM